jgi:hypothetical protein
MLRMELDGDANRVHGVSFCAGMTEA